MRPSPLDSARTTLAERDDVKLTADMPALWEMREYLCNEEACRALAVHLLNGYPGGGYAFIERKRESGGCINWQIMAHDILVEWCRRRGSQATASELHRVLQLESEASAADFVKDVLLFQHTALETYTE